MAENFKNVHNVSYVLLKNCCYIYDKKKYLEKAYLLGLKSRSLASCLCAPSMFQAALEQSVRVSKHFICVSWSTANWCDIYVTVKAPTAAIFNGKCPKSYVM